MHDEKVVGGVLVLLGAFAFVEARRLVGLRTEMLAGAVVGDDTFPMLVAVSLFLVGGYLLLARGRPRARPSLPAGAVRSQMLWSGAALIVYCALVPYLGYAASTLVGSTALFRTMGRYRSTACLFLGALTTGGLYLVFRVWLRQPLPTGLLGF
ncbi:MAG TPA: tripartite tricarboxylate transporter TctB family protein [bacterium]|nr:tripartite tricarboxylate transporter TctB family protein [bacterium]